MMDMGAKKYAYEYELAEWKEQFKDTDGEQLDDDLEYWRIPMLYSHDLFIPDETESINRYLAVSFEDAGNNVAYDEAVKELQELEPYTTLESWEWPLDGFYSKYEEE
ncbi:hypothetical protein [Lentilactobacillus buchneri]|uniref:hypothetical protein n=1 Tax=Lentilactobacillus buchneri TaxID=1581 RepID=UPI0002075FAE|nr:hypothetical protein [Lentilactobacillus buchneri]AEB73699.1 hypothetical protein Lbuc_1445 [Lentilactobacillus buchneri NRRL B-30929]